MSKCVLDSSALLAIFNKEPGGEIVATLLENSLVSAVNFAETINKLVLGGLDPDEASELASDIVPNIVPFDKEIAILTAKIVPQTKPFGLSLGDRACLATALFLKCEAVTADKIWAKANLPIKIKLIR